MERVHTDLQAHEGEVAPLVPAHGRLVQKVFRPTHAKVVTIFERMFEFMQQVLNRKSSVDLFFSFSFLRCYIFKQNLMNSNSQKGLVELIIYDINTSSVELSDFSIEAVFFSHWASLACAHSNFSITAGTRQ